MHYHITFYNQEQSRAILLYNTKDKYVCDMITRNFIFLFQVTIGGKFEMTCDLEDYMIV